MRLQYMLSNGNYVDASAGREEYFIKSAVEFDQRYPDGYRGKLGLSSIEDAISQLEQGWELRHGSDWYDKIRDGEAFERKQAIARAERDNNPNYSKTGWELDCGHIVHWRSHIMSASRGSSCTDCYDRMSN